MQAMEPSIIIEEGTDGTFWKVYYVDKIETNKVKMVKVNGNRIPITVPLTVYTHPGGGEVDSPEVRFFNGNWHLFYNVHFPDRTDIYKVESFTNENFYGSPEVLIENSGATYCATIGPGVLEAGGDQYDLYFGLTPRQAGGSCKRWEQRSICRWRWQD